MSFLLLKGATNDNMMEVIGHAVSPTLQLSCLLDSFNTHLLQPSNGMVKGMFSVMSVCLSVCPDHSFVHGPLAPIPSVQSPGTAPLFNLDLTAQPSPPHTIRHIQTRSL